MPLRWTTQPSPAQSPLAPAEPKFVLAAPGSLTPRHRLTQVLAAGSLLAVAMRPAAAALPPRAAASTFTVTNLNPSGSGSLRQAIDDANAHLGADVVTFQAGLTGTIPITTELFISDSVQIVGPGPGILSVSGGNATRIFYLYSSALFTTTISGLTIRDGAVTKANGGGILDTGEPLTLDNVRVVSNTASAGGGGIFIGSGGAGQAGLTLRNSIVSGNGAPRGGGVNLYATENPVLIQNTQILSNTAQSGGGVYFYQPAGNITIEDSTIAGNHAVGDGGGIKFYYTNGAQTIIRRTTISGNSAAGGGGLSFYGLNDPVSIENSTISGNSSKVGGGIYTGDSSQHMSIRDSTIVSNTATTAGGGIYVSGGTLPITNTIVAKNGGGGAGPDIDGPVALSYDLVEITTTAVITDNGGNVFGLDPLLGPLADNGGPTQTHLPQANSPAPNAGDPTFAPPPATDQRGQPRVSGGRIDIGAVEVMAGALQFSASNFQVAENALTATVTVTRTGGSEGAVSVQYATGGGTATAGIDYQTATGTLHWASGDTAPKSFPVTILNDNVAESNQTVGLTLSNVHGGAALGSPITATLTIIDDGATQLFLPLTRR